MPRLASRRRQSSSCSTISKSRNVSSSQVMLPVLGPPSGKSGQSFLCLKRTSSYLIHRLFCLEIHTICLLLYSLWITLRLTIERDKSYATELYSHTQPEAHTRDVELHTHIGTCNPAAHEQDPPPPLSLFLSPKHASDPCEHH